MSETKFTHGPWKVWPKPVENEQTGYSYLEVSAEHLAVWTAHVLYTIDQFKGDEEARANAQLIAAAPSLLKACERVWRDLGDCLCWAPSIDTPCMFCILQEALYKATNDETYRDKADGIQESGRPAQEVENAGLDQADEPDRP